jgi:hypothetical protein
MALFLDAEVGDEVRIGESRVRIERKNGSRVRLRITSSEEIDHSKPGDTNAEPVASILPATTPFTRRQSNSG